MQVQVYELGHGADLDSTAVEGQFEQHMPVQGTEVIHSRGKMAASLRTASKAYIAVCNSTCARSFGREI